MAATAVVMGLTGCSSDSEEPTGLDVTAGSSESPPDEPSGPSQTDDVAAIEQLYADYWDAVIASENGPNPDPTLFDGIATGAAVESHVSRVQRMVEEEQQRFGEPTVGDVKVTVDGDTARAEACVDQQDWGVIVQGQTQPPFEGLKPGPMGTLLERTADGWLIVDDMSVKEASVTC